jgi:hypothetical protein
MIFCAKKCAISGLRTHSHHNRLKTRIQRIAFHERFHHPNDAP